METLLGQLAEQGVVAVVLALSLYFNFWLLKFIKDKLIGMLERSAEKNEQLAAALERASQANNDD